MAPKKGSVPWNKGRKASPEEAERLRQMCIGRKPSYGMLDKSHSQDTREKMSKTRKGRPLTWRTATMGFQPGHVRSNTGRTHFKPGKEHPYWVDGLSREFYRSAEHRRWRRAIIERDKECQYCGSEKQLQAHHVNGRINDVETGICLCKSCHTAIHKAILSQVSRTRLKGAETTGEVQSS